MAIILCMTGATAAYTLQSFLMPGKPAIGSSNMPVDDKRECHCRSKVVPLAGMLSQCLGSRSTDDANRLMQPIVRAATKAVQQGAQPAEGSPPGPEADKVGL